MILRQIQPLRSVRYLEMYQEIVNLFADALEKAEIHSEGMQNFKRNSLNRSKQRVPEPE